MCVCLYIYIEYYTEACVCVRLTSLSNGRRSVVATANSIYRCRRNCRLRTHITRDHNTTTTYKSCTVAAATNCHHSDRTLKTITLLFRRRRSLVIRLNNSAFGCWVCNIIHTYIYCYYDVLVMRVRVNGGRRGESKTCDADREV